MPGDTLSNSIDPILKNGQGYLSAHDLSLLKGKMGCGSSDSSLRLVRIVHGPFQPGHHQE